MEGSGVGKVEAGGGEVRRNRGSKIMVPETALEPVLDADVSRPMLARWSQGVVLVLPCGIALKIRSDGRIVDTGTTSDYGKVACPRASLDEMSERLERVRTRIEEAFGVISAQRSLIQSLFTRIDDIGETALRGLEEHQGVGGVGVPTMGPRAVVQHQKLELVPDVVRDEVRDEGSGRCSRAATLEHLDRPGEPG